MKARLLIRRRVVISTTSFAELVLWSLPTPVHGSDHGYKYRLALVTEGQCVLRYDNEAGKGDHKHVGDVETPYAFTNPEVLMADFFEDVARRQDENS
jgi:hypothetical protein